MPYGEFDFEAANCGMRLSTDRHSAANLRLYSAHLRLYCIPKNQMFVPI